MQILKPGKPAKVLLEIKIEGDQSQQEMNPTTSLNFINTIY